MSRRKSDPEYERTLTGRFTRWFSGRSDPYLGQMEMKTGDPEDSHRIEESRQLFHKEKSEIEQQVYDMEHNQVWKWFQRIYQAGSVLFCVILAVILLILVAYLPASGTWNRPVNNEVSQRYIEDGIKDTGAVNYVAGMILSYRAFDTFGETCVLFIATTCVMMLLMRKESDIRSHKELNDRVFEPKNDLILQKVAFILVPIIFLFGIYVILNGHLSPGGGFSGGAIIGAGMILYVLAYGFNRMQQFFHEEVYKRVKVLALCTYCIIVSYYIITGANGWDSLIPLGTPGAILSAGIILWLNICVGIEVACTMYAFYALFRRGGL